MVMFSAELLIGLIILGSLCLVTLILVYVSWRYVDYLESLMPRSEWVLVNKRNFSDAGLPGKIIRFGAVSMTLAFSKFSVRKGMASDDDIKCFPKHIRIMLVSFLFFTYFMFGALLVASYVSSG